MITLNQKLGENIIPVCVTHGTGDIMISVSVKRDDGYVDVYLSQVESGDIGINQRKNHQEKSSDEIKPAIMLRFNKIESIEALIFQLEVAKVQLS